MYYNLADFSSVEFGRPFGSRDKQKRRRILRRTLAGGAFGAGSGAMSGVFAAKGNRLRSGGKAALLGGLGWGGLGYITSKPW